MYPLANRIGFKAKLFEVLSYVGRRNGERQKGKHLWKCKCICSKEFIISTDKLKTQKHCGDKIQHPPKHGLTRKGQQFHPIYRMWCNMKVRCYGNRPKDFKYYKSKGISICSAWLNDAKLFFEWCIKNGWEKGMTIDRIDSEKDYEPTNCQLLTRSAHSKKTSLKRWENVRAGINQRMNDGN